MKRNERVAGGVRTEKLGRKVRAQDDGALARATDMRPSTSIEGGGGRERGMGIQRIQWPYTSPPPHPAQPTLPSFVRSFVRSFPSTRRVLVLFSTTCIRKEQRSCERIVVSFEGEKGRLEEDKLAKLSRWMGLNVRQG